MAMGLNQHTGACMFVLIINSEKRACLLIFVANNHTNVRYVHFARVFQRSRLLCCTVCAVDSELKRGKGHGVTRVIICAYSVGVCVFLWSSAVRYRLTESR